MKRFWQVCMAVVVTAAMANAANAQWNDSSQIGSYQSILARAGYGNSDPTPSTAGLPVSYNQAQDIPAPPGAAMATQQMAGQADGGMMMAGPGCATGGGVTSDCGCGGSPNCGCRLMRRGRVGGKGSMNSCGSGNCLDTVSNDVVSDAPVYDPGNSVVGGGDPNWVLGVYGLSFRRDYDDGQRLACNAAGDVLYSDDVDHGNINGVGITLGKRCCTGSGWEAIFWGMDDETDVTLSGTTTTHLFGLGAVAHPPSGGTVQDVFDVGDNVRVYRDSDIYNFEFNVLRNGGQYTTWTGRCANYELLFGFRLFDFDESLRYVSYTSAGGFPATIEYSLEAENTLAGFQLGGRSEVCLTDKWSLAYSGTAGVFNNNVYTRQQILDSNGYWAMDYSDTKNDAAMIGQVDLGLIYQFSCNTRARIGYRAMGVSGVALADDQIPLDFTNTRALESANSNGSLLLYGFYYGGEYCF